MQAKEIYSVDGLPPEWGGVVADFVRSRAERYEPTYGMLGEYQKTLDDKILREKFTIHAKVYSGALWKWCNEGVPENVKKWVDGDVGEGPKAYPIDRLGYLIYRRETMIAWDVRGKTHQTPKQLRFNAIIFMSGVEDMLLAVALRDFEYFEHIVKVKKQPRPNKIDFDMGYYLMVYWMIWSLWKKSMSLDKISAFFYTKMKVEIGKSRLGELISDLGLRPSK